VIAIEAFAGALKNSNFKVLKCYKLLLYFSKLLLNYGFIIMSIILLSNLILMIIYCFKGRKKITELISYFIKIKFENEDIYKPKKSIKSKAKINISKEKIGKKKEEKKTKNSKTNKKGKEKGKEKGKGKGKGKDKEEVKEKEKFKKNMKNEKKAKSIKDSINKNKIIKNNKDNKDKKKSKKLTAPSNIIINKKNIIKEIKIKIKPKKNITKNNFPPKKRMV